MKEQLLDAVIENLNRESDRWVANTDASLTFLEKVHVSVNYHSGITISLYPANISTDYELLNNDKIAALVIKCREVCKEKQEAFEKHEIEKAIEFLKQ